MSSSMFSKRLSLLLRLSGAVVVLGGIVAAATEACLPPDAGGGGSGDRCNPDLSHDECGSGLVCAGYTPAAPQGDFILIPFCPENYCCAADSTGKITDTNPVCQPGCNGGAQSMCSAGVQAACAFVACVGDGGATSDCIALATADGGTTGDDGGQDGPTTSPEGSPEASLDAPANSDAGDAARTDASDAGAAQETGPDTGGGDASDSGGSG